MPETSTVARRLLSDDVATPEDTLFPLQVDAARSDRLRELVDLVAASQW
jgi:hypothetical protein